MAKHTQKNDALGMFSNTKPVNIKKPAPVEKVEEKVEKKTEAKKDVKKAKPVIPEPVVEAPVITKEPEQVTTLNTSKINLKIEKVKKERTNNTRSFYLKDETYNKLVALAKENNVGISECLEYILGQIL